MKTPIRSRCIIAMLCVLLVGRARLALAEESTTRPRRPNVLFIAVDDLNLALGCYGHPLAKTPNIDALASRGVRFDLTYCQYPLCNPSRVSMLTGVRPDTSRVYDLQRNFRSTMPDSVTLPQLFRQNGYFVARAGKIFHYGVPREIGTPGMDDPISWERTYNPAGRDKIEENQLKVLTRGTGTTTIGFAMAWREMPGTDEEETDGKSVTQTIGWLEEMSKSDQPFFIGMGFFRPHTPFVATKKWFETYPKTGVLLPPFSPVELKAYPDIALYIHPPNYGLNESDLRDCLRGYLAAVSFVDDQVGKLLATLDRLKLADNTIVVLFSDNGFMLGEHGQWQKQLLFDESPRVPLIILDPRHPGSGKPCMRPVELLDVYPTVKAMCQLPDPPQKLEGHDLTPLLADPTTAWEHAAYSQVTRRVGKGKEAANVMGYTLRTQNIRYTEWGDGGKYGREFYDHDADPRELHNGVDDPLLASDVAKAHELLAKQATNFGVKP